MPYSWAASPHSLLLRYAKDRQLRLPPQDLYGPLVFPLQLTVLLSEPGKDFTGGEFVLVEQRPRAQSRPSVGALFTGQRQRNGPSIAALFRITAGILQGNDAPWRQWASDRPSGSSFTTPPEISFRVYSAKEARMDIIPNGQALGARVNGMDLRHNHCQMATSAAILRALRRVWRAVFASADAPDSNQFAAFGRRFGKLEINVANAHHEPPSRPRGDDTCPRARGTGSR